MKIDYTVSAVDPIKLTMHFFAVEAKLAIFSFFLHSKIFACLYLPQKNFSSVLVLNYAVFRFFCTELRFWLVCS